MLLGSATARFDSSGRIKIPQRFRSYIEETYGPIVFITSITPNAVQIYPYKAWKELTKATTHNRIQFDLEIRRSISRVSRRGLPYEIDSKGRVLISQVLRNKAQLEEEVEIVGMEDHLEVWNPTLLDKDEEEYPLDEKRLALLAGLGPKEDEE